MITVHAYHTDGTEMLRFEVPDGGRITLQIFKDQYILEQSNIIIYPPEDKFIKAIEIRASSIDELAERSYDV